MRIALGVSVLAVVAFVGWFVWLTQSELSECFAGFDSREQAERAAAITTAAGFDADVEDSGPNERKPTSEWGRRIGVHFSDGATGEDAEAFVRTVEIAVSREDGFTGRKSVQCSERPRLN